MEPFLSCLKFGQKYNFLLTPSHISMDCDLYLSWQIFYHHFFCHFETLEAASNHRNPHFSLIGHFHQIANSVQNNKQHKTEGKTSFSVKKTNPKSSKSQHPTQKSFHSLETSLWSFFQKLQKNSIGHDLDLVAASSKQPCEHIRAIILQLWEALDQLFSAKLL